MSKSCNKLLSCEATHRVWKRKNGFRLMECESCGLRNLNLSDKPDHVGETFSDNYFFAGKQGYPDYLGDGKLLNRQGRAYAEILARYKQPGDLLDVGCAAGFIMKGFEDKGWRTYGLDPNDTMAAYGRNELGLHITTSTLEDYESPRQYDLISLIQVIGHLYDLDSAFSKVSTLLKPDGIVLIESWDMNSLYARIMGNHWHELCPPSVLNWFSDDTLAVLLQQHDLVPLAKGRKGKRINVRHGLSLLEESMPNIFFKKNVIKFLNWSLGKYTIYYPPLDLRWYLFKRVCDNR